MKRYRWSKMGVIAAVMALSVAAIAGEYTDKKAGFAFTPPSKWKQQRGAEYGAIVFFMSPNPETGANMNIVTEDLPGPMSLSAYSKAAMSQMGQVLDNYKRVSYKEVQIGSMKAGEHVYTASTEGMKLKGKQLWFVRGKRTYIFTFTSLNTAYNRYIGEFDKSVRTVRWLK